ncbi:NO-inducible flavohemoprotein [Segetibacter koreensis]|uniref:NO-inducible flavohemoprotein n=1 Tax=Segetibacter koreensis TaxID=398037 RepID=UPI000378DF50|nr:NO-inducible flavohemoprotein [Segetibacter koreensis]
MTIQQKDLVKATVPVLKENGVVLTTHFYNRMLSQNPELRNVFNSGNQHNSLQPTALAMAVLAYAENIDDPSVLKNAVNRIANKHVSLDIRPEHYAIVGKHLLASIGEVLGDAATPELVDAWAVAYDQLARIFIGAEADLYSGSIAKEGGWTGWRPFIIKKKVRESKEITSFYLYPSDGGKVRSFLPGQYISVRLFLPEINVFQPRQYSLSSAYNDSYYRISVKREAGNNLKPEGLVSNRLHHHLKEGDVIEVAPPAGDFTFDINKESPVFYISGGVGVTPLFSMLETLVKAGSDREITWIHGARHPEVHAFKHAVAELSDHHGGVDVHTFYDEIELEEADNEDNLYEGFVDLEKLNKSIEPGADYYICGPAPFIKKHHEFLRSKGVEKSSIHFEEFGPSILIVN